MYRLRWGCDEEETWREVFRTLAEVRGFLGYGGEELSFEEIKQLEQTGLLRDEEELIHNDPVHWIRLELIPEPLFHAQDDQRIRKVTLLWAVVFFLTLAIVSAWVLLRGMR
jgi:hypothetical protein